MKLRFRFVNIKRRKCKNKQQKRKKKRSEMAAPDCHRINMWKDFSKLLRLFHKVVEQK